MADTPDPTPLDALADRLLLAALNGPAMQCRPHRSRQRIDLARLATAAKTSPADLLHGILTDDDGVELRLPTQRPMRIPRAPGRVRDQSPVERDPPEAPDSPAEKEHDDSQTVGSKLRTIAEDARVYEQDTGISVLAIGFPLLHIPPDASLGGAPIGRRILAPLAFLPITLTVRPNGCHIARRAEMTALVPNSSLYAWLERHTGKAIANESEADDPSAHSDAAAVPAPLEQLNEWVQRIAAALKIPAIEMQFEGAETSWRLAPEGSSDTATPALVQSAVIGLFPMAKQGLIADMRSLCDGKSTSALVDVFTHANAALAGAPPESAATPEPVITLLPADPCQQAAVLAARDHPAIVLHGPPGTGKSQTIANIIADHLLRGQRVLFVCDKRTALDVVASRLKRAGLESLFAIVHDPRRDQREFFRAVRAQLDTLAQAETQATAERKLANATTALAATHAELSAYDAALTSPQPDGTTLHQMIGEWLAIPENRAAIVDHASLTDVPWDKRDDILRTIHDLMQRASRTGFADNPWRRAIGITLNDFLAHPRTAWDAPLAALESASRACDGYPSTVPLPLHESLDSSAAARTTLADLLAALRPRITHPALQNHLRDSAAQRAALTHQFTDAAPHIARLRAHPLDAELSATRPDAPPLPGEEKSLLETYAITAPHWFDALRMLHNAKLAKILAPCGLARSKPNAQRLLDHLRSVQARQSLGPLIAAAGLAAALQGSELIDTLDDLQTLLHALDLAEKSELLDRLTQAALLPEGGQDAPDAFINALRASVPRIPLIAACVTALDETPLLAPATRRDWQLDLRNGISLTARIVELRSSLDSLDDLLRVTRDLAALPASLRPTIDDWLTQKLAPDSAIAALQRSLLAQQIDSHLAAHPGLLAHDAADLADRAAHYQSLQRTGAAQISPAIRHRWTQRQRDRLLAATGSRLSAHGADLRRRLTSRGPHALRLRQVLQLGAQHPDGDPLLDICPVWMASPESVAQLFPRAPLFDLVIFDEASQCRLEDALPVLLRGKRLLIAGDPHQLPPTRFFESAAAPSDADEASTEQELFAQVQASTEDLLSSALNLSVHPQYLEVHYRSSNEELIQFSNHHFYRSRLQTIPGHPKRRSIVPAVVLDQVPGIYDQRRNVIESARVVQIVHDLLRRAEPPSIGIVCFNLVQRDQILDDLDALAEKDADFATRLAAARARVGSSTFEGLFVKNVESVQGDERDHLIISTTFGPDPHGRFYRRFGPLGLAGSGRRLNVLVTRARHEVHLVTSIPPSAYQQLPEIGAEQQLTGAYLLLDYLRFAARLQQAYALQQAQSSENDQSLPPSVARLPTADPSGVVDHVADRLVAAAPLGATTYYGSRGFCVDLMLHSPSGPDESACALLCDASRFSPTADRIAWDLFRAATFIGQGWNVQRLWSPHLYRDPPGTLATILKSPSIAALAAGHDAAPPTGDT
jgi:hypothetical protein